MKYKIWDKEETLVTPIGEVLSPAEVIGRYPAAGIEGFKFVVADQPLSMAVFMEFESVKSQYKQMGVEITEGMTDQEVLDAITAFEETPQTSNVLTAEERIAAALEFQNVMSLPIVDGEE